MTCPSRRGNRKGVVDKANHAAAQRWWRTLGDDVTVAEAQARVDRLAIKMDDRRRVRDGERTTVGALAGIREQWERARKVNIAGEQLAADTGPLADAVWMKNNLARAKMALPNGYCALPLQQKCEFANACLTCPVFRHDA